MFKIRFVLTQLRPMEAEYIHWKKFFHQHQTFFHPPSIKRKGRKELSNAQCDFPPVVCFVFQRHSRNVFQMFSNPCNLFSILYITFPTISVLSLPFFHCLLSLSFSLSCLNIFFHCKFQMSSFVFFQRSHLETCIICQKTYCSLC